MSGSLFKPPFNECQPMTIGVIRADKRPVGQHERQFNAPTIDEVAIVIVGEEFESRDIILHRRSGDIQRVSETHQLTTTDCRYPILFLARR
ncbi:helitron_like_N domain-containing protein [Trichonephila clavipes]|nr:helitron_like_N domain-containing protein [Trichonephila clavipes]